MDEKQRTKYTWAVYLIVGLLAIVLGLVSLNYFAPTDPVQSLLLNLATELAGVVLIFIIVNRLFSITEDEKIAKLTEQVEALRKNVISQNSPLYNQDEARERFDAMAVLMQYHHIDLLGYTNKTLLGDGRFRNAVIGAVQRGASIRIIFVDTRSSAGDLMRMHSNHPKLVDQDFEQTMDFVAEIDRKVERSKGNFEVRHISWIPSCGMFIGYTDEGKGVAKIDIHLPSLKQSRTDRRSIILDSSSYAEDFNHFFNQYNLIWDTDSYPATFENDVSGTGHS